MSDFLTEQNKELKTKNDTLEKELAGLKDQLAKSNVVKLEQDVETLKTQIDSLGGDLKSKSEALSAKEIEIKSLQAKVDELVKSGEGFSKENDELKAKLTKIEADQKIQSRVAKLVEAGLTKDIAEKDVATFAFLDDSQFDVVANRVIEAAKLVNENKKTETNTSQGSNAKVDETTIESAVISDTEVLSVKTEANIDDEVHNSLVKNLTAALKTSDKENGDK